MKEEKERKGKKIVPKTKLHEGKAFGICKKCEIKFRLKHKTKHKKGVYYNVICPKCGKAKMKDVKV
jgi:hypothetical protein